MRLIYPNCCPASSSLILQGDTRHPVSPFPIRSFGQVTPGMNAADKATGHFSVDFHIARFYVSTGNKSPFKYSISEYDVFA